jgi:hypothetical protein
MVSFISHFTPQGKSFWHSMNRWVGLRASPTLEAEKNISPLLGFEPHILQPIAL